MSGSEQIYRKFLQEINCLIIGIDKHGNISLFNHFSENLFGFSSNDLIGKPLTGTIIPQFDSSGKENSLFLKNILSNISEGYTLENEALCKDGKILHISWKFCVLQNEATDFTEILLNGSEITHQKENKQAKQVLNAILQYSPAGIILVDENARITNVSRYLSNLISIEEKDLVGAIEKTEQWGVLNPVTRKPVPFNSMPLYRVTKERRIIKDEEYLLIQSGKEERVISISAGPVLNSAGEAVAAVSIWADITTQKKLYQKNVHQRKLLEQILNQIPVGVALHEGIDLVTTLVNSGYYIFSQQKTDMIGKPVEQIWPEFANTVVPALKNVYKTGQPYHATDIELVIDKGNGPQKAWYSFSYLPFFGEENKITGVLVWSFETTEYVLSRKEVENTRDQLRSERALLQAIIDGIPVMITLYDPQIKQINVNNAFVEITGWTQEDSKNNDLMKLVYPDGNYRKETADFMQSVASGFRDFQMRSKSGKIIESSWANIKLPDGRQVGIGIDITERKKIETALENKSAQLEATINSIPDGYIVYNNSGEIQRINSFAKEVLGYVEKNFIMPYQQRMDLLKIKKPDGKPFPAVCLPSMCALRGETVRNEIMQISRNGYEYWLSVSASPISLDGKTLGAIMEFSDITELHKLQEELTGEKNFVNAVLQTSGALTLVIDPDSHVVRFNRACEELTGYTEQQFIGHSVFELIPEDEINGVKKIAQRLFSGESNVEYENHWLTRSGEKRFIRWKNSTLLNDQGKVAFLIATGIDITDRKKLQEDLTASNNDLESFSYSVSHDLRGPIGTIGGFTTFLIEDYSDRLDADGQEYLRRINSNVKKAQQLIDDLLSLSRAGRKALKKEKTNLSNIVSSYLDELSNQQPSRQKEFFIQQNVFAFADPGLIRIALENLLRNSWKFTSKADITRIWFGTVLKNGVLTYYIRDNGVGFDSKFATTIFQPFKRVHPADEFSGTGIGLSIVQRIINRHQGKISAEGEVNNGATFFFNI